MIVVRFVFQAKSGKANDLVEGFKQGMERMQHLARNNTMVRILTDLSGPFDTVVQEIELESLAAWEELRGKIFSEPEFQELQEMDAIPLEFGRTEFYTLEASFEYPAGTN
jgi:hypothetical protein